MKNFLAALQREGILSDSFEMKDTAKTEKTHFLVLLIFVIQDDVDPELTVRRESQVFIPATSFMGYHHAEASKAYLLFSPESEMPTMVKYEKFLKKHYGDGKKWDVLGKPALEFARKAYQEVESEELKEGDTEKEDAANKVDPVEKIPDLPSPKNPKK